MGTGHIIIHGVSHLNSVDYTVMSDRIVAGTYLAAAAATCGDVSVYGVCEKRYAFHAAGFGSDGLRY